MDSKIEITFQRISANELKLFFRTKEPLECEEPLLELGEVTVQNLCDALGDECIEAEKAAGLSLGSAAEKLSKARGRLVLINGWQSWSFAGELKGRERPRRALLRRDLNLFVDHPAERALRRQAQRPHTLCHWARRFFHRHDIISDFLLGLRTGELRLMLLSDNVERWSSPRSTDVDRVSKPNFSGDSNDKSYYPDYLPPVSFLLRGDKICIFAYAAGGSFAAGEIIARLCVFIAPDYFSLKDRLSSYWHADRRFEDLSWLIEPKSISHGMIGGYASWYNHYTAIDERIIGDDLKAIKANDNFVNSYFLRRSLPTVFQIDDGWEVQVGDWQADPRKFPNGMAEMAQRIVAEGLVPGIWLAPFLLMPNSAIAKTHPEWLLRDTDGRAIKAAWNPNWGGDVWALDLSRPDVENYLISLFETIVNVWGYRYLKLDFLYAGLMQGAFSGRKGGVWQHYTRIMARILEFSQASNGEPVAFLSCGAPIESTAPFMPLMRSGADTREHWEWLQLRLIGHQGRPSAKVNLEDSIGRAILDKTLLFCDPDVIFYRTDQTSLKDTEKFLIGMVAAMFGSQLMTSDDPARFTNDARIESESDADALSEAAFTKELVEWYRRIEGKGFGVERNPGRTRGLYDFFSRDGSIYGAINLSDREQLIIAELSESFELSRLSERSETSKSSELSESSEFGVPAASLEFPIPRHSMIIFGI